MGISWDMEDQVGAGSIRLHFLEEAMHPTEQKDPQHPCVLKICCMVLLFLSDAQHSPGQDPTLLKGLAKVREAPPGNLHGFNPAALEVGQ